MDLFDLALKTKDHEWAKELLKQMEEFQITVEKVKDTDKSQVAEEAIALENLFTQYAVKEENGVRGFNINSDFDRNKSNLIVLEGFPYKKGETVKYYVPSRDELLYMRGTVNGFVLGYREGVHNTREQFIQNYMGLFNEQEQDGDTDITMN